MIIKNTQIATIGVKPLTSIIVQRVTTQPQLSWLLLFTIQHVPCRRVVGARGGRGVRAVGVATLKANSVKKAKDKRKN